MCCPRAQSEPRRCLPRSISTEDVLDTFTVPLYLWFNRREEATGTAALAPSFELDAVERKATGPAYEIGWLSTAPRVTTLRYTWAADATDADVAALAPQLLNLASLIEAALVGPAPL